MNPPLHSQIAKLVPSRWGRHYLVNLFSFAYRIFPLKTGGGYLTVPPKSPRLQGRGFIIGGTYLEGSCLFGGGGLLLLVVVVYFGAKIVRGRVLMNARSIMDTTGWNCMTGSCWPGLDRCCSLGRGWVKNCTGQTFPNGFHFFDQKIGLPTKGEVMHFFSRNSCHSFSSLPPS